MFENLSERLERSFKILKGEGSITEINVAETLKDVRRALLDADVNYKVAKTFTDTVKQKALGQNVLTSVKPGQLMVKIVHDELAQLMGGQARELKLSGRPSVILMAGLNGAGKTTLFKMIMGQEKPDGGTLKIGETVEIISMEQGRDSLDDSKTVWESITGGNDEILVGDRKMNGRAYCGLFNFTGAAQQKKLTTLSGGERNRVLMAKNLQKPGNVLFLDEPTNDLDIETLQALEQAILKFAGCAVIISHDRWFLDRIATHILAYEGDSKVVWFEGNWSEYEADRRKRLGEDADNPKPIRYKTLMRQ